MTAGSPKVVAPRALSAPVTEFLTWLTIERGRSPRTVEAYTRDLRSYEAWLDGRSSGPLSCAEDDLVAWIRSQLDSGRAPSSVARSLAAVRTFHNYAVAEGHRSDDPAANVAIPSVPAGLPKALREDEVEALIDTVQGWGPAERRDRCILEVLYGTGLRISELVGLSLADVDLDARLLRAFGKGAKERVVPLGRMAHESLVSWLSPEARGTLEPERWASRSDAEALLLNRRGGRLSRQGAWGVVKKYGAKVGLGSRLSPHVLRHSCATHMLDHGADIRTVQELLGHASISTTQIYTRVSPQRLIEVHRDAHPRAHPV